MKNHRIVNLKTPENSTDAVNWTFLGQKLSNYTHETGFTMQGDVDLNNHHIFNVANSCNNTSAVNRKYVNDELKKKLDKNKDINMAGNKILSYRNPCDLDELVNKSYVDLNVSKYLPINGSLTMQGELSLGLYPLTDLPEPKFLNDATTKKYVDSSLNSKIDKILTYDIDLNNSKMTNLKKATQNKDAVNLEQLNESASVISATTERLFFKKDGTNLASENLDLNNNKIVNMALRSSKNDGTNKSYVDQKMGKILISSHENR